jgi:hypothetical protein
MPEQDHLLFAETSTNEVDELVEVADELLDRHRLRRDAAVIGAASAALLPIHHQEPALEVGIEVPKQCCLARAGTTMQKNHGGVRHVHGPEPHSLLDAANHRVRHRRDAAANRMASRIEERRRMNPARNGAEEADENCCGK